MSRAVAVEALAHGVARSTSTPLLDSRALLHAATDRRFFAS
jgi:hypothetical protein